MKTIFLAFPFNPEDRELVGHVERLMASLEVRVTTGERAGGDALPPAIMARIDQSDGLVGLLTRNALPRRRTEVGQWVLDELGYARSRGKRAIALVENGVTIRGAYAENERIPFDRRNLLPAFLALAETVSLWKAETGRVLKVKILPQTLARTVSRGDDSVRCRHRLYLGGRSTEWKEVVPVREPGGPVIYVEGVREEHTIELEIQERNATWVSEVTPQLVQIQLARRGANR